MLFVQKLRYNNIFIFSSPQFTGHLEEYFAKYSKKLVAHVVYPRKNNKYNLVRVYKKGNLVIEKKLWSSENIFVYFFAWYIQHLYCLFSFFTKNDKVYAIVYMPHLMFLSSVQKMFRKISYIFFVGDYCPDPSLIIRFYEWTKKYYHTKASGAYYLSDTLNKIMNDGVKSEKDNRRTIMWGVNPKKTNLKKPKSFSLLFVGLIKQSQGIQYFYNFLKMNKQYTIKILGTCDDNIYSRHKKIIRKYHIENQVYFPNRFFTDREVEKVSQSCHVGVALYDTDKMNMTYYTEPGKVKYYTELGLPVIISNVSSIVPIIKKFKAGEVIERDVQSINLSLINIKKNYKKYLIVVKKLNNFFYYDTYYKKKFIFLEQ